jgi:N6-adenosine-specific RNA methylase IME4
MKYNIIYADPPWNYKTYSCPDKTKNRFSDEGSLWRNPKLHYECMELDDIKSLNIEKISAENCILFLWTTSAFLESALQVIKNWGFTYKSIGFVWIKKNLTTNKLFWGMGYWTRNNAEFVLIATKGHPKRISKSVHQVIMSPKTQHSKKPDEVREKIVQLIGDLPRVELFAREKYLGWDAIGNAIDGQDIKEILNENSMR